MRILPLSLALLTGFLLLGCQGPPGIPTDKVTTDPGVELIDAIATYEYQKEMYLDSVHRVEFTISRGIDREQLYEIASSFAESDHLGEEKVEVGDEITAQLIDPSGGLNYKITSYGLATKKVFSRDTFEQLWEWDVLPLKAGDLPLRLNATTRINGYDVDIPVFDTNIKVYARAQPPSRLPIYLGIGVFFIGSVVLMLFLRGKKQRQEKEKQVKLAPEEINELNQLIGAGEVLKAIQHLEEHLKKHQSEKLKDLIVLKSSFQENKRKSNLNVIDSEDAGIENSRINLALLDLIGELKEELH